MDDMQAYRVRKWLGLVAAAAAAVLVVGLASTARAQDCNGALNITIPSPKAVPPTGPYLNVGDSTTVKLNLGSGTITGGTQITLRRLRYELDCNHLFALGVPCTDQGTIMSYDFTQTVASGGALVQCQGHTWTATAGSSANEVLFTPDTPIVLAAEQSSSPTLNSCCISFEVKLDNLEPTSGATSDDTPQKVEVVAGFSTIFTAGHADAECNNGGSSGVSQSSGIFTCPNCTVDQCNLGCDTTTGTCTQQQASTPCGDTDGNTCTTAGCELSAGLGVCVQTHLFAENSTPCADSDGNACTTAGCNGQGVCDQNHSAKVCPPADECNQGCDTTSGQCTPQASTPCTDSDGNTCTTAGCEVSGTNPELGVCVQTHLFASNSTPCADSDGNACTTAGCNGQGVCDQNHGSKVCPPADQCNKGCDTTSGLCTPQASTPCTDTDGNTCTTAGCEVSGTNAELGVCVQTHLFAENSTACADRDSTGRTTLGCFTRTPGFWGTHPAVTQAVLGSGLPSCGLVVDTTAAATPVSATEDICSVGTDSKANNTSPQQVQLIRQCMAAALNLAATARAPQPGDCNSVFPGITATFNTCCTGPTSVCDRGASAAAIDASVCIWSLDRFNSLETTIDIGVSQGPANSGPCQASKNNGFLNPGRNLGSK